MSKLTAEIVEALTNARQEVLKDWFDGFILTDEDLAKRAGKEEQRAKNAEAAATRNQPVGLINRKPAKAVLGNIARGGGGGDKGEDFMAKMMKQAEKNARKKKDSGGESGSSGDAGVAEAGPATAKQNRQRKRRIEIDSDEEEESGVDKVEQQRFDARNEEVNAANRARYVATFKPHAPSGKRHVFDLDEDVNNNNNNKDDDDDDGVVDLTETAGKLTLSDAKSFLSFDISLEELELTDRQTMDNAHMLIWFTGGSLKEQALHLESGDVSHAHRKLSDVLGTSRTVAFMIKLGKPMHVELDFDDNIFSSSNYKDLFMHVAVSVQEDTMREYDSDLEPIYRRHGESCARVADFSPLPEWKLRLWDGPSDLSFQIEASDMTFCKTMTFDAVGLVSITNMVCKKSGNIAPAAQLMDNLETVFANGDPVELFDAGEKRAVCEYFKRLTDKYRSENMLRRHSFVYVSMPMKTPLPLATVMFIHPMSVGMEVFEARLRFQRETVEGISERVFVEMCEVVLGRHHDASFARLQRLCWVRLQAVISFVLNPFAFMLYCLDTYKGKSAELMGAPRYGVGDCEDTAEAAHLFLRALPIQDRARASPAMRALLEILQYYTVIQTTMVTASASLDGAGASVGKTKKNGKQSDPPLHMCSFLVVLHTLLPEWYSAPVGYDKMLLLSMSVEATGLNPNCELNTAYLVECNGVSDKCGPMDKDRYYLPPAIKMGIEKYTRLRDLAGEMKDFERGKINAPSIPPPRPGASLFWHAEQHPFYGGVTNCVYDPQLNKPQVESRFPYLDIVYKDGVAPQKKKKEDEEEGGGGSSKRPAMVTYADFIAGKEWKAVDPISLSDAARSTLFRACRKAADNLLPLSVIRNQMVTDSEERGGEAASVAGIAAVNGRYNVHITGTGTAADPTKAAIGYEQMLDALALKRFALYMNYNAFKDPEPIIKRVSAAVRKWPGISAVEVIRAHMLSNQLVLVVWIIHF
jgi:hypothetical protein